MADQELTALTAADDVDDVDLLYVVKNPSGTPVDRKATAAQVRAGLATTAALTAHEADTTSVHGIADTSALVTTTSHDSIDHSTALGTASINDLADVTVSSPSSGQVLKWNGSAWVNDTDASGGGSGTLNDLTDVTITAAATGDVVRYNGTAWVDYADSNYLDRANHTGSQAASTISDFSEAVDDRVNALIVAGSGITKTYDDSANTLTIAASGGGGSLPVPPTPASASSQWGYPFAVVSGLNGNTGTIGRNQLYYTELYVPTAITITGVAVRVITAAPAAFNVRVGIVAQGADRMPSGNSLTDTVIACGTTGSTVYSTTGLSVSLAAGKYLVAWVHDSATDINFTVPSTYSSIGAVILDGSFSSATQPALTTYSYPASWPTPMPTPTSYSGGNRHIVHMRWS